MQATCPKVGHWGPKYLLLVPRIRGTEHTGFKPEIHKLYLGRFIPSFRQSTFRYKSSEGFSWGYHAQLVQLEICFHFTFNFHSDDHLWCGSSLWWGSWWAYLSSYMIPSSIPCPQILVTKRC